ncbi:MAG: acyltransferase [Pseudomonadota bacterium]|nr:acyltransferase [Pseudomonadota bacterium]
MRRFISSLLPDAVRLGLRKRLNAARRARAMPRMIRGYQDGRGLWRPNVRMSDSVCIQRPQNVVIEDLVWVWHYSLLDGTGGLEIGEGTQIGAWSGLFTHSSHAAIRLYGRHYLEVPEDEKVGFSTAPVRVGRYVLIGHHVNILPGVTIGDGAVIRSGAMVTKDVAPFQVVGGSPAEPTGDIRALDKRLLRRHSELQSWYEQWQRPDDDAMGR